MLILTLRRRNVFASSEDCKGSRVGCFGGLKDRQQTDVKSKRHFLTYRGENVSVARGCNQGVLSLDVRE